MVLEHRSLAQDPVYRSDRNVLSTARGRCHLQSQPSGQLVRQAPNGDIQSRGELAAFVAGSCLLTRIVL